MITADNLHMFVDDGHPLIIETRPNGPLHYDIRIYNRGQFRILHSSNPPTFFTSLRAALRHYPNQVLINGETRETTPFPDLARMMVTTYHQKSEEYPETKTIQLQEGCSHYHHQNLLAAGVLTHMKPVDAPLTYYTPGTSGFPHWQPAHKVTVTPIAVVTREEFQGLSATEVQLLLERNPILPLVNTLVEREAAQLQRTIRHPKAPNRYGGPIRHYAAGDYFQAADVFKRGAPIIVHRTPVAIDPRGLSNPEYISVAEALYTQDQELVPVGPQDQPLHTITEIVVQRQPAFPRDDKILQPVNAITIEVGANKSTSLNRLDATMWLTNESEDSYEVGHIFHVPGQLDRQYLADCLIRAYWNEDPNDNGDNPRVETIEREMAGLARAATGEPTPAYRDVMQGWLDNFSTQVPKPPEECSVTSQDGTLTLTYRPRP